MAYMGSKAQAGRGSTLSIGPTSISITGDTTSSSTSVASVSSTAGLAAGMPISGTGIPADTTIASVGSETLTLSAAATATGTAVALTVVGSALIGEISDLPLNRGKWDTVDVTNLESGSDSEFLPTMRKPGALTLKGNRVNSDAGQLQVESAYQSGSIQAFTTTLPKTSTQTEQGDSYTFNAYVLNYEFSISPTKQIDFSIDLQISGPVTLTSGS